MAESFTMDNNATDQSMAPPSPPQTILVAVETHYIAQRARAIANINGYLGSSVGVAEHPDVVGEVINLLKDIDEADGMINTLRRIATQQ